MSWLARCVLVVLFYYIVCMYFLGGYFRYVVFIFFLGGFSKDLVVSMTCVSGVVRRMNK